MPATFRMGTKRLLASCLWLSGLLCLSLLAQQPTTSQDSLQSQLKVLLTEKKDSTAAILLLEKMLSADSIAGDWASFQAHTIKIAEVLNNRTHFPQVHQTVQRAIRTLTKAQQGNTPLAAKLWSWIAVNHKRQDHYAEALDAYQTAIQIYEANQFKGGEVGFAYKNAAQIFMRHSNNNLALAYLKAGLAADTAGIHHLSIYTNLAKTYFFLDSLQQAKKYYELGQALSDKDPDYLAGTNSVGAALALQTGDLGEARRLTLAALQHFKANSRSTDNLLRSLTTLADIAARQQQPVQAHAYYRQAEAEGKKSYTFKSREMAKLYIEWGRFWEKQQRPDSALHCYQHALVQAFPQFNSLNTQDNPSFEGAWVESQAIDAALAKAMLLIAPSTASQKDRERASYCFEVAFYVADRMRRTYGNDADKLTLAANLRPALNAAALNLQRLYAADHSPAHLFLLFSLLEQNRATALADALRQQHALALTGIPDTSLAREENLRREVARLEKELKENELKQDSAGVARLQPAYFRASMAYGQLLNALQRQYPRFRQYTQAQNAADLKEIALAVPDTAALLLWHDAGDRYLCATLQPDKNMALHEVLRDTAFDHELTRFIALLSDKTAQERDPAAYFSAAHFLGEKLLPSTVLSTAKSLIIIPDGSLCRLPFEALMTQPHSGGYANAPYLLRSHTVQYAWSGTLLAQYTPPAVGDQGMLQLAPFATSTRDGLPPLPNSLHDKPEHLSADVLQGAEATTGIFLQKAPAYAALHLSTHASAGGRAVPGIEFADRTLALPEIYAQRFHASLVSLSACETAAGPFAQSEGVLSLARAFAYAGAQSLVASHWSVNERSTADLFSTFYENLKRGLPKAEALRQAKLRYLASAELDARKLPFHWAAFTLTGLNGTVQLEPEHGTWKWVWVVAGAVLAVLGWMFFRRKP